MTSARAVRSARTVRPGGARRRASAGAEIRRRSSGSSALGLPLVNVIIVEIGLAAALVLLARDVALWPVAAAVLAVGFLVGCAHWHGRWVPQWMRIQLRFVLRRRLRHTHLVPPADDATELERDAESDMTGPEDARVALLRLLVDDLVVAAGTDHGQQPVGLAWHEGTWTAALLIDPTPAMVSPVGAHTALPLTALAGCLQDRGVVLDTIGVIWHCYPGSSRLPADSPAVAAYHEVLGPLPAVAQRSTWVTVRLDPHRCPSAVRERGGGVPGAHRALLGALSRVQGALELAGLGSRVLSTDELLRAAVSCAELATALGRGEQVQLREHWSGVRSGGIFHSSHSIGGWPADAGRLDVLTSLRALSTTIALALTPEAETQRIGLRGVVRVTGRTPEELHGADERVRALAVGSGIRLEPLNGQQAAAIAATLPIGGAA